MQGEGHEDRDQDPEPPADTQAVENPGGQAHLAEQRKKAGHAVKPAVLHFAGNGADGNILGDCLRPPPFQSPSIIRPAGIFALLEHLDVVR